MFAVIFFLNQDVNFWFRKYQKILLLRHMKNNGDNTRKLQAPQKD